MSKQNSPSSFQTQTWSPPCQLWSPPNLGASLFLPFRMSPFHPPGVVSILPCQQVPLESPPCHPHSLSHVSGSRSVYPPSNLVLSYLPHGPTHSSLKAQKRKDLLSPFQANLYFSPVRDIDLLFLSPNYIFLCPAWRYWS